ncbi:hypothetical protein [Thermomonas sp.]|uniref:hypothetical protein n=1 Tax=Thermomonas sp. TaxID=1971895 RepID=UPI0025EA097C|nr:hypothetical protein [Thermomonas sp.]
MCRSIRTRSGSKRSIVASICSGIPTTCGCIGAAQDRFGEQRLAAVVLHDQHPERIGIRSLGRLRFAGRAGKRFGVVGVGGQRQRRQRVGGQHQHLRGLVGGRHARRGQRIAQRMQQRLHRVRRRRLHAFGGRMQAADFLVHRAQLVRAPARLRRLRNWDLGFHQAVARALHGFRGAQITLADGVMSPLRTPLTELPYSRCVHSLTEIAVAGDQRLRSLTWPSPGLRPRCAPEQTAPEPPHEQGERQADRDHHAQRQPPGS